MREDEGTKSNAMIRIQSPSNKEGILMSVWEYGVLRVSRDTRVDLSAVEVVFIPPHGQAIPTPTSDVVRELNRLGAEGWEITGLEIYNGVFHSGLVQSKANWIERKFWLKRNREEHP
jgi:hypothetical protein